MLRPFYVCYFIAVAVSLPFFPPYLRSLGLSGKQVSAVLSLAPLMHLGVPLCWGWLADRTRRPDLLLRIACLGAFVCYGPLIFVRTMPALLFVMAAHQIFAVAINGLSDTLAIARTRVGEDYGKVRFWGSLSFTVACLAIAPILASRGRSDGDPLVPILLTAALGLTFLSTLRLRGETGLAQPHAHDVRLLLRDRRFLLLIVVAPLHWAACTPYHGFFGILLQDRGLGPTTIGNAFVVSVLGEMVALYKLRDLRARFSLPGLLAASFATTVVRFLLTALATSSTALIALQSLHALTFGLFWGTALAWIGECVPPKLRATGQTLYTAATLGLGSILGMLGTGALYDLARSAAPAFLVAGVLELVPLTLVLIYGRRLDPAPRMRRVDRAGATG